MKIERLKKAELDEYCKRLGIEIKGKKKAELIEAVYMYQRVEIDTAIESGKCLELLKLKINALADEYAVNLKTKIHNRREEMRADDNHTT